YFNYNNDLFNITASDMVSWRNLNTRINNYAINIMNPNIRTKFSSLMEDINDGKVNTDSLVIEYIRENTTNSLLAQLLISHYYNSLFSANKIGGYENNQNLI